MSRRPEPRAVNATAFALALSKHLSTLGWKADQLATASTRYPFTTEWAKKFGETFEKDKTKPEADVSFKSGIGRAQAFGLLADKTAADYRPPTRVVINILAHELAAHYEAKANRDFSRGNAEVILAELLEAAGFAPYMWSNDRWDEIIDNPNPESRTVRIGYFPWPGMIKLQEARGNLSVEGKSVTCVQWLLRALRIVAKPEPVKLSVNELYDPNLFLKVDLVAPLVGIPARRFALAYSNPIGGYSIGQNVLVHKSHASTLLDGKASFADYTELPQEKLSLNYVKGGVSELLVDELEKVPDEFKQPSHSFVDAIEKVAIHPEQKEGRIPCFIADSVTCADAMSSYPDTMVPVIKDDKTMLRPLVFGLPQRPEVLQTVNEALDLVQTLKVKQLDGFIPKGIRSNASTEKTTETKS